MSPIVDKLAQIVTYNSPAVETTMLSLNRLLPTKLNNYYRYPGSLTTPGCDEVVEWFVLDNPVLTISDDQLLSFQSVEDNHGYPILSNSRPIQDINFRTVKRSFGEALKALPKSRNVMSASGHTEIELKYGLPNCNHGYRVKAGQLFNFMGIFVIYFFKF